MKMKFIVGMVLYLLLVLAARHASPAVSNRLMSDAWPRTSAFRFYVFDGETVLNKIVFHDAQAIANELQSIPAQRTRGWTLDDITLPIYGIQMSGAFGRGFWAAWSNGYWITQTGNAYRFDFDFKEFIERQYWEHPRDNMNFTWFPNAVFLTRDEEGWRNMLLTPMTELNPPEGIEMALVSNTNDTVTFTLTNNNEVGWTYGTPFTLEVLIDNAWYEIPAMPVNFAFAGIALYVGAGQTETKTYNIAMYGDLPPGTYRLVKHDMYAIFEIN